MVDAIVNTAQSLNASKTIQQVSVAAAKTALEAQEQAAANLLNLLEVSSPAPGAKGSQVDVTA